MKFGVVRDPLGWEHWPEVRALLDESCRRSGDVFIEEVEAELAAGKALLWATDDASFTGVTQLFEVRDGKQCFIWQMAGADHWLRHLQVIEDYARAEGCTSIEGNMRPGFERFLTDWRKVAVVLRKDLT